VAESNAKEPASAAVAFWIAHEASFLVIGAAEGSKYCAVCRVRLSRSKVARAYAATGRWQKATVMYRQVLAGYERTLGPGHLMTRQYRDIVAQLPPRWLRALAPVIRVTRGWRRRRRRP
jgi:hypothetical protein